MPAMSWRMRGLEPFYQPLAPGLRWPLVASHWVRTPRTSLGLPGGGRADDLVGVSDRGRVLWICRENGSNDRKVVHWDSVLAAMKRIGGFDVEVLEAFSHDRTALMTLLTVIQRANVLAVAHGAGLAHALYMSEGSALLELKGTYSYSPKLFIHVAILGHLWFYAVDVRDHQLPSGDLSFPPGVVVQTFEILCVELRKRANRTVDIHCDPTSNYETFLQGLPHLGAAGPPANDDCDKEARAMDQVGSMMPQASQLSGSIQELCKAVQGGGAQSVLIDFQTESAIRLKGEEVDKDSTGNHVPAIFLPNAMAELAKVDIVKLWEVPFIPSSLHSTFFGTLQRKVFRPAILRPHSWHSATTISPACRLEAAAGQVCRCTTSNLHTCRDAGVWAAFQAFWRPRFRESILEVMQPGGTRPIDTVGAEVSDLGSHVRCGDILKYNVADYGYLGISALEKALEDRSAGAAARIRILTNLFAGADLPQSRVDKDQPKAAFCFDCVLQLSQLVEEQLAPAKVHIDNTSETTVAWAHLALVQRTLCNPSTYCLWPTLAATHVFWAVTPLFFSASHPDLTGVTHLEGFSYLSTSDIFDRQLGPQQIVDWIRLH